MSATKATPTTRWMIRVVQIPPKREMIPWAMGRSGRVWGSPVTTRRMKVTAQEAAVNFVEEMKDDDLTEVMEFGSKPHVLQPFGPAEP